MTATKLPPNHKPGKTDTAESPRISIVLIDAITEHIADRHSTLTENQRFILALWIIHTYFYMECAAGDDGITPYLHITSIDPDAGKSTIARILRDLCYQAQIVYPTVAVLGQFGVAGRRTMILDEIHNLVTQRATDIAQFNAFACLGNQPGNTISVSSKVPGVPDERDPFYPKAWLGIGPSVLEYALSTRCIRIIVSGGSESDQSERERRQTIRPVRATAERIKASLDKMAKDDGLRAAIARGMLSPATRQISADAKLYNRMAQLWRGLITIADLIGPEYGERVRACTADYIDNEPVISLTLADKYDAGLRALMRERKISADNWAMPGKAPLKGAVNFGLTDADFGYPAPRNSIRGKLPSASLIFNAAEVRAELRFKAAEFAEVCAALPGSPSKSDVTRAYTDAGRLHAKAGRSSTQLPMHSGQGDISVIAIDVSTWIWPDVEPPNAIQQGIERILSGNTLDNVWEA